MKEKIQLLSRGVFEYENPEIEVSEKEIALEVEAGSHYSGTIQLNSRNHIEIRAMIFSSNKYLQCLRPIVSGQGCELIQVIHRAHAGIAKRRAYLYSVRNRDLTAIAHNIKASFAHFTCFQCLCIKNIMNTSRCSDHCRLQALHPFIR